MTHPSPAPSPSPPAWPHCGHGATGADPIGCRGVHVGGHTACLAHLDEADRAAYLAALIPGADIDHRGTSFAPVLLDRLLTALHDSTTGRPHLGTARFDGASFSGTAGFDGVTFSGDARFREAVFSGSARFFGAGFAADARFEMATFLGNARFDGANLSGDARFDGASFSGTAGFDGVAFSGSARFFGASFAADARFGRAVFSADARFGRVTFCGSAVFDGAVFARGVWFNRSRFEGTPRLGPLVCGDRVVLDGAVFQQPVVAEIAARRVSCARTRWASTATLHLRYAELDLRDAVLEYPVVVAARPTPFPAPGAHGPLVETELSGRDPGVRLTSLGGVDAAHLALHDIDLSRCRFAGAVHLDQLKVDGWCTFAPTPPGWSRRFPWRWSPRNTLTEEHHWRIHTARRPDRATARGWTPPPPDAPELRPAAVAALYRQLRKSLEDGKNEPDAADFYYGECEMRRHDATRPRAERALLTAYWAVSGYGLRASRALVWLGAAMAVTFTVLLLWGLPADDPEPTITGRQVTAGKNITLTADTPDPRPPDGPLGERVTAERIDKALRVVVTSVVFRSSGQNLTPVGTYTEMASRLAEPVLLGLAVLAVRSRVKR